MTITARTYLSATSLEALAVIVAAAITDDSLQPAGYPTYGGGVWMQAMDAGTAPGSIEDVQADILSLQTDLGTAESTISELGLIIGAPTAITADGAIEILNRRYVITKAGVAALTLAAPSAPQEGTKIEIINGTANAHVITATNLLDDGVTGGAKDTATFAAFVGSSIVLLAYNLKWVVLGAPNNVTIAAV